MRFEKERVDIWSGETEGMQSERSGQHETATFLSNTQPTAENILEHLSETLANHRTRIVSNTVLDKIYGE